MKTLGDSSRQIKHSEVEPALLPSGKDKEIMAVGRGGEDVHRGAPGWGADQVFHWACIWLEVGSQWETAADAGA